jgi:hypothetical protein
MKTFKDLLIKLNACNEAKEWAEDRTIEEVLRDSWRGDWYCKKLRFVRRL